MASSTAVSIAGRGRYSSAAWVALEWRHVWSKTWNMGPRLEELPQVGDFVIHELGSESFIFVRCAPDEVKAYPNVCRHRGTRLCDVPGGVGKARALTCPYHRWSWDLRGNIQWLPEQEAFPQLQGADWREQLTLPSLRLGFWGGWIWFSMDERALPLEEFLGAVVGSTSAYSFEQMRLLDYKSFEIACNWKISVDAFSETYHVPWLHGQVLSYVDERAAVELLGQHSLLRVRMGSPSARCGNREAIQRDLARFAEAHGLAQADVAECGDVRGEVQRFHRATIEQQGLGNEFEDAQFTDDFIYNLFPNVTINAFHDGAVIYRHRPHATDPQKMIFDLIAIKAVSSDAPIARPRHELFVYDDIESLAACLEFPLGDMPLLVLEQDLDMFPRIQKGAGSRAFSGAVLGSEERAVLNFHTALDAVIRRGEARRSQSSSHTSDVEDL